MLRPTISFAAAACLALSACATTAPTNTPAPTASSTMVQESPTTSPVQSQSQSASATSTAEETPKGPPPDTASPSSTAATDRSVDLADHAFAITPQQAIEAALAETGDGIVHSIELDWSQRESAWAYEIDVLVGNVDHDVDVHADTGEILKQERDTTDDKEQAISLEAPMTWEVARDKALDVVQGRITSWKLEWDDGRTQYEFDIEDSAGDEAEVSVDAATGDVQLDD